MLNIIFIARQHTDEIAQQIKVLTVFSFCWLSG